MSEALKFQLDAGCVPVRSLMNYSFITECQFYLCGASPEPFEMKICTPWLPVAQERRNYVATFFGRGERATSTQQDGSLTQAWSKSVRPPGLGI